jgi:hypothetical protein
MSLRTRFLETMVGKSLRSGQCVGSSFLEQLRFDYTRHEQHPVVRPSNTCRYALLDDYASNSCRVRPS